MQYIHLKTSFGYSKRTGASYSIVSGLVQVIHGKEERPIWQNNILWNFLLGIKKLIQLRLTHVNPLNAELIPICHLSTLLGAHHFLHVSRIRVKSLTLRLLMSYIYIHMEHLFLMFLDHTQRRTTVGRTPLDE